MKRKIFCVLLSVFIFSQLSFAQLCAVITDKPVEKSA